MYIKTATAKKKKKTVKDSVAVRLVVFVVQSSAGKQSRYRSVAKTQNKKKRKGGKGRVQIIKSNLESHSLRAVDRSFFFFISLFSSHLLTLEVVAQT